MNPILRVLAFSLVVSISSVDVDASPQEKKGSQQQHQEPIAIPASVAAFLKVPGDFSSGDVFIRIAKEELWKTYSMGPSEREALLNYLEKGPDGPGLAFAAMALISFHEPRDVEAIAKRALDRKLSSTTRWYFLNAAPYVLAIGDVWLDGEGDLDREAREQCREFRASAVDAAKLGLGRWHAGVLRQLYDVPEKVKAKNPDHGLLEWHQSAYLLGTLDLRDQKVLEPLFDPREGVVFVNLISALSYAAARDFVADLAARDNPTKEEEERAAAKALAWWKGFLASNPDGSWRTAAITGLAEGGFKTEADLKSAVSRQAFLQAIESESKVINHAAYRLLNHIYETHFDLEIVFFAGKYALSPFDPSSQEKANLVRLKVYWQARLSDGGSTR